MLISWSAKTMLRFLSFVSDSLSDRFYVFDVGISSAMSLKKFSRLVENPKIKPLVPSSVNGSVALVNLVYYEKAFSILKGAALFSSYRW